MNKRYDDEIIDDDEVFEVTREFKTNEKESLEEDTFASSLFDDTKADDIIEAFKSPSLSRELKHEEKPLKKSKEKVNPLKVINGLLLWLLFIIFVTIVIYIMVNEPEIAKKITSKIF